MISEFERIKIMADIDPDQANQRAGWAQLIVRDISDGRHGHGVLTGITFLGYPQVSYEQGKVSCVQSFDELVDTGLTVATMGLGKPTGG